MAYDERTRLLIGNENADCLRASSAIIFGLGGVGSYTAEALVRAGIGTLIAVDGDTVSESNINRQLIALHSTIGMKKTEAFRNRALDINPDLRLLSFDTFLMPDDVSFFFSSLPVKPDFICDCIDTVSTKLSIIEHAAASNTKIISCMGTGNKLDPSAFRIADIYDTSVCPLCRVMRRELKKRNVKSLPVLYSEEKPSACGRTVASISFVPSAAGILIASYAVSQLLKKTPFL